LVVWLIGKLKETLFFVADELGNLLLLVSVLSKLERETSRTDVWVNHLSNSIFLKDNSVERN